MLTVPRLAISTGPDLDACPRQRGNRGTHTRRRERPSSSAGAVHTVSRYGDYRNLIAPSLFSHEVTGTAFGIGAVMAVRLFLALSAARTPFRLLAAMVAVPGAGNTFFTVALPSAVPAMVGQEARCDAHGLLVTGRSVATALGFISAAPAIAFGGYASAFAVNAASFVVSVGGIAGAAAAYGRKAAEAEPHAWSRAFRL